MHVELLDAPSLRGADGARLPLERKAAALIALLALEGARPRGDVAALLWPEVPLAQARNSLRQRLFRLQRAVGRELVLAGHELRLAADVRHDLDGIAERLAADPQARLGELLGGLDYGDCVALGEWVEMARARWREQRRSALAQLAAQHEARGEIAQALRYAERLASRRAAARAHAPARDAAALPARRPRRGARRLRPLPRAAEERAARRAGPRDQRARQR